MMDILKLMYLSDLLGCIKGLSKFLMSFGFATCGMIIIVLLVLHMDPPKKLDYCVAKAKKYLTIAFTVAIVSLCTSILIPRKDLRNIFVGAVAIQKVYENEAIKNLTDKVLTLVNQRLDALIETKGDKHE